MQNRYASVVGLAGFALVLSALMLNAIDPDRLAVTYSLLGTGAVALVFYLVYAGRDVKTTLTARATRYGANAVLYSVVVLGIVAVANFIAVKKPQRWDLTEEGLFTLSEQTESLLKGLQDDVSVVAFYAPVEEAEYNAAKGLFESYQYVSPKFKFRFIDPAKNPIDVKNYKITSGGPRIIVTRAAAEGREERIKELKEQTLTNAIIKLTRTEVRRVYFLRGHEEGDIEAKDTPAGFGRIAEQLTSEGYQVAPLQLLDTPDVPADAQVVVIAGPRRALVPGEVEALERYTQKGGHVLVMLEPQTDSGLDGFLGKFGVGANNDFVLDATAQQVVGAGLGGLIQQFDPASKIVEGLQVPAFFPTARSLKASGEVPAGAQRVEFARTGDRAWGEVNYGDLREGTRAQYDEGADLPGPVTVGVSYSRLVEAEKAPAPPADGEDKPKGKETRIVVYGDSEFASNALVRSLGNADLFLNTIAWLAEEEDLIAIRPKEIKGSRLTITGVNMNLLFLYAQVLLPAGIFLTGIGIWLNRRKK
jgi:ABC-type uncharacterized transport system involved in gliding motility auxiliary subunit